MELAAPLPLGVTEVGLSEHLGAAGDEEGDTEQIKATAELKPVPGVTVTVPVAELPAVTLAGESVPVFGSVKLATAVPVRATCCGLPAALSVMLKVAVRVPAAVGANVT